MTDPLLDRQAVLHEVREQLEAGTISFGQAIRRLRTSVAQLNQNDFAKACRLSSRHLRQLEQDDTNPTVETLNMVFRPFGMQVGIVPVRRRTQR